MSRNRNWLIHIFTFAVLSIILFSMHDASAVNTSLSDMTSCLSLGGSWDGKNSTCALTNLSLNPGDSLNVDNGIILKILWNGENYTNLTNDGTIIINVNGTIVNNGNVYNFGKVISSGTVLNTYSFLNHGVLINDLDGEMKTSGSLINYAEGTIANNGTLFNTGGGIQNSGGTFINNKMGTFENSYNFLNDGDINNFGNFTNNGADFESNIGHTVRNYGTFLNVNGGDVANRDIFINLGAIDNYVNHDMFSNYPAFTNSGSIYNQYGGIMNNFGYIYNVAIIYNNGTIFNYCGGSINNNPNTTFEEGIISGNPVKNMPCMPNITPTQATQNLINTVNGMNLTKGITDSLDVKLDAAINSLTSGYNRLAINHINSFINEVNGQTGKNLTIYRANLLVSSAQST